MELDNLGLKYGTDKASNHHRYLGVFEAYLMPRRNKVRRVLEIGVMGGASLRMWRDYFPNAEIHGLDHNAEVLLLNLGERIVIHHDDINSDRCWPLIQRDGPFDLIVDDGSHHSGDMILALVKGWPLLADGGLWITEDLHALYRPEFNQGKHYSVFELASQTAFAEFFLKIHRMNTMGEPQLGDPLKASSDVEFVHWWRSLVLIGKRP